MAGGPGFKVYCVGGFDGYIVVSGRHQEIVPATGDMRYHTVARYVTLPYQPIHMRESIKQSMDALFR